jgi:hypothetical protein
MIHIPELIFRRPGAFSLSTGNVKTELNAILQSLPKIGVGIAISFGIEFSK